MIETGEAIMDEPAIAPSSASSSSILTITAGVSRTEAKQMWMTL